MLVKIYAKLGLARLASNICQGIKPRQDTCVYKAHKDQDKICATRLSVISSYGQPSELKSLIDEYQSLFNKKSLELKNRIV
jgi:hypothetical protein